MNTSQPRTDSANRQYTSPLVNVFSVIPPSSIPSLEAIFPASAGFARPVTSTRRLLEGSSSSRVGLG